MRSQMTTAAPATGARARTRRAIVAAAIDVLAENGSASLGEVATAAEVSRTTVHRYFAERSDLMNAVTEEVMVRVVAATERARPDQGPAPDALARMCREYFELGSVLTLLFNDVIQIADEDWAACEIDVDRALEAAVERGHDEGSVDPELTPAWIQQLLWALIYVAWNYVRTLDQPRQEGLELAIRSLRRAIAA
jgi:TetR/AcrR family transcriptional regulator, repressor for lfrA